MTGKVGCIGMGKSFVGLIDIFFLSVEVEVDVDVGRFVRRRALM